MRIPQPVGERGSQKWIQRAVKFNPECLQPGDLPEITWLSPLENDEYAEYRDEAFLDLLGLGRLSTSLKDFWPKRGPQWDALGISAQGPVLVEAKAHVKEFFSPPSQAGAASLLHIERAFGEMKQDLGVSKVSDWTQLYCQYANRLAFLWWLRKNGVEASLLFVSFCHDDDMKRPRHKETWQAAFASADYALGIPARSGIGKHVFHVMPDVRPLASEA